MELGVMIGILGSLLGLAGGALGTYVSIKSTKGPLEKMFMLRASVIAWILLGSFLALLLVTPSPYRFFLWIPYIPALVLMIQSFNRQQIQIRSLEQSYSGENK